MNDSPIEFSRDIRIDPEALDIEWLRQSELFHKWSEKANDARSRVEKLELRKDTFKAQLEVKIRGNPEKYGVELGARGGVTEGAVKAAIAVNKEYIEEEKAFLKAKRDQASLISAVQAMDMKRRALENLVALHNGQYFAGPSVPRKLKKRWEDRQTSEDRVNTKVLKLVRKRRKESR